MASVPGYIYALGDNALYVNLFVGGSAEIAMGNRTVKVEQETRYPWDGRVKISVDPNQPADFAIKVRIPGWARNEAVPGDLYRFVDSRHEPVTISVNGQASPESAPIVAVTYVGKVCTSKPCGTPPSRTATIGPSGASTPVTASARIAN